ncbi:hypothetical protein THRCLA_08184 [Thraustotheca clavata]|uniref:FYVE-type domain-containing protein n=1 Tax=Thraustotheca clavata TaxID=74557 RepID=A0A1V9Z961_9STRA|nr:hypothetical protein THRCLA_08184 [Thraustotheca clavata]
MAWAQRDLQNALSMDDLMKRDQWVPDDTRQSCFVCTRHFHQFRRKHHCRMCGEVVCASCVLKKLVEETTHIGLREVKVCMTCLSSAKERHLKNTSNSMGSSSSGHSKRSMSDGAVDPNAKHAMESPKSMDALNKQVLESPPHSPQHINYEPKFDYELDYDWEYSWPKPPTLTNEAERLEALQYLRILDTPHDEFYDSICELASNAMHCPIAVISFMDSDRQWFKACIGLTEPEIPRDISFCAHTIMTKEAMVVLDATMDPRFVNNPLVTGPTNIRFYAGVPLIAPSFGLIVGTLFVMDAEPHAQCDISILEKLSNIVMKKITSSRGSTSLSSRGYSENYAPSSIPTMSPPEVPMDRRANSAPNLESMMMHLLYQAAETQYQLANQKHLTEH